MGFPSQKERALRRVNEGSQQMPAYVRYLQLVKALQAECGEWHGAAPPWLGVCCRGVAMGPT